MKHLNIYRHTAPFKTLMASRGVQAAIMSLAAGESSSEDVKDEHPSAEQWLYVVAGRGSAQIRRRTIKLEPGDLLLIPRRTGHRITNTGRRPLLTLNFYSPPAYTPAGEVKSAAKKN